MKKCFVLAFVTMMCSSVDVNAQGFLKGLADKAKDKVKEKIEKKVDNAVGNAADKVLNGKSKGGKSEAKSNGKTNDVIRLKEKYGEHDGFIYTTHGVYDAGEDPFQIYVEQLAAPATGDRSSIYTSNEVEADDVTFRTIEEAIKAFPPLPTVQQMLSQDAAPVKALENFSHGVSKLGETYSLHMVEATGAAKKKAAGKKGISSAQMDNGAAQIFAYMQKHGIDPDKMSDKEMEALLKKAVMSGEIKIGGTGFAIDPGYTEEQDEAVGKIGEKVDAILAKPNEFAKTEGFYSFDAFNLDKTLKPLYTEIQSAWLKSDACKQVYAIEKDIDKRAWEYFEKNPDKDKSGDGLEYPDFWVQGRKQQNEIIRKFNTEQSEKWRKVLQEAYDKYLPSVKEIPVVDKELEALLTDKNDLIYSTLKQHLATALMQWNLIYTTLLSKSYGVPLVSETFERDTIIQ